MPGERISRPSTPERKLYQLVVSRLNGDELGRPEYRARIAGLVEKGIGGFIVFGGGRDELRAFIRELQGRAETPLFIASDIERGVAQQVAGTTPLPCPMATAAALYREGVGELAVLEDAVRALAAEAREVGITMPLVPVVDVNLNPDNPIICTRAFSDKPDVVAWFGTQYVKVLEAAGLISCPKHFPGHGDTAVDSHIALPVIGKSRDELELIELPPFAAAIKAGASSIMVGHLAAPALDTRPASLSRRVITDLLRKELGFTGLILTDALNMDALRDFGDVPVECLKAGADILLHPADADETVRSLSAALASGRLAGETVETAVDRIIAVKSRPLPAQAPPPDYERNSELSRLLIERSITLVKGAPAGFPLSDADRQRLVIAGDAVPDTSPLRGYFSTVAPLAADGLAPAPVAVVALFTSVSAWKGTSGIGDRERQALLDLIERAKKSVVISFGSPYVLRYFGKADILIAAYEGNARAQRAVVRRLAGEAAFTGRLPIDLYDRLYAG